MREYPVDPMIHDMWKLFPLRIPGQRLSRCCQTATLLVQSMDGGFVTQNCAKCGNSDSLKSEEFEALHLWVACPECRSRMAARMVELNYGYVCDECELSILLADLLPRWSDLV